MKKPKAHKEMMKERPHKDPPRGSKAYARHERSESKAMKKKERRGRKNPY